MVKCRRVTIKKHGDRNYTVNLAGRAMWEKDLLSEAKRYAKMLRLDEKRHCGKKLTKKEEKYEY